MHKNHKLPHKKLCKHTKVGYERKNDGLALYFLAYEGLINI